MAFHVEDFGAAVTAEQVATVVAHGAPVLVRVVLATTAAPAVARPGHRLARVAVCEHGTCRGPRQGRGAAGAIQSRAAGLALWLRFDVLAQNLESVLA